MQLSPNEIFSLGIIYILAYGAGLLVSKFWGWLRLIILFVAVASFVTQANFKTVNMAYFLVFIVPMCLFVYPSLIKILPQFSDFRNPFSWIFEKISESRYHGRRKAEQKREQENLKRAERIVRMQTEEAERNRQYEREKAEREARERAEHQKRQQANNQHSKHNESRGHSNQDQQKNKTANNPSTQDPYEVLGVTRGMNKADIRKVYLKLMQQYAPDHVAHLGKEFQQMAHEKCVAFNLAWEKIQKGK